MGALGENHRRDKGTKRHRNWRNQTYNERQTSTNQPVISVLLQGGLEVETSAVCITVL